VSAGRNDDLYNGARIGVRQSQTSPKFVNALPHSSDTDADALGPQLNNPFLDSFAIIANRNCNSSIVLGDADPSVVRSGMPEHVR